MILTPASLLLDFLGLLLCLLADGVLGCGLGLGPLSLGLEFYYLEGLLVWGLGKSGRGEGGKGGIYLHL